MYNILITSTNPEKLKSYREMCFTLGLGFEYVYACHSLNEARHIFNEHHPDIILVGSDELTTEHYDFIKDVKQYPTVCYVKSKDTRLETIHQVYQLKVNKYFVDEVQFQEMQNLMIEAIQTLKQIRNENQQKNMLVNQLSLMNKEIIERLFYLILVMQDEILIQNVLRVLRIKMKIGFAMIIVGEKTRVLCELDDLGYTFIEKEMDGRTVVFVFSNFISFYDEHTKLYKQLSELSNHKIYFGRRIKDAHELHVSYEEALYQAINHVSTYPLAIEKEEQVFDIGLIVRGFIHSTLREEKKAVEQLIIHFIPYLSTNDIHSKVNSFIDEAAKQLNEQFGMDVEANYLYINSSIPLENFQDLFVQFTKVYFTFRKIVVANDYLKYNTIYRRALKIMNAKYMDQTITLIQVAEQLNITSSYLSKLFSKNSNQTFSEVLNDIRIKKAKNLIKEGKAFKEVAALVGYTSASYFAKAFKKNIGLTPSEYKNLID